MNDSPVATLGWLESLRMGGRATVRAGACVIANAEDANPSTDGATKRLLKLVIAGLMVGIGLHK